MRLRVLRGMTPVVLERAVAFGLFFEELGWYTEASQMLEMACSFKVGPPRKKKKEKKKKRKKK
jgi:hypothetical protein